MLPYHLAQLAAFCSEHSLEPKVLFVPSHQIGYNLTNALSLNGFHWANLSAVSPLSYAGALAEPQLRALGLQPASEDTDQLLVEDLLGSILRSDTEHPLHGRPLGPGLVRAFLRTLRALRMAGTTRQEVEEVQDEAGRTRLLARLSADYERALAERGLHDDAAVLLTAIDCVTKGNAPRVACAILDETQVSGLSGRFVRAVTAEHLVTIGREDYGCPIPANTAAARFTRACPTPAVESAVGPGGKVLIRAPEPHEVDRLRLVRALDVEAEIRFVLREVLGDRTGLDAVEIAYTTGSPYLVRLCSELARLGLPVTFAEGIPAHLTRPGQALSSFLGWIASGFDTRDLIAQCRANLLDLTRPGHSWSGMQAYEMANVFLRVAPLARGRLACEQAFARLKEERDGRRRSGAQAEDAAEALLVALFSLTDTGGDTSFDRLAMAAAEFVTKFAPIRDDRDALARNSLADRLKEIARAWDHKGSGPDLARRLIALLENHTFEALSARPGHLHVVPLNRCGYTGREHLYILGMDEGSFPGGASEDPILLDREREHVSSELDLLRTGPASRTWHLIRALGAFIGRVTLITRCRNLADGREVYPSPLFQHVEGLEGVSTPVEAPMLPDAAIDGLDDTEAVLSVRRAENYADHASRLYPVLHRGASVSSSRSTPGLTRLHGLIGAAGPGIDPLAGPLSASRLEVLARCPYQYFLKYVLQIAPLDEPDDDPSVWLQPLHVGGLLHDLFCSFMRRLRNLGETPQEDAHAGLMAEMLQDEVNQYRDTFPPPNEAAYQADLRRLNRATQVFLASEADQTNRERLGFEVSFGFGEKGGFNAPDPVMLPLTEDLSIELRGRIDRVDRTQDGLEIWDYKTGSAAAYDETDLLKDLAHLQWALYAYALEEIVNQQGHPEQVGRSGYFFTSDREHGRRIAGRPPARETLARALSPCIQLARNGAFLHLQRSPQCTWCDYADVCRSEGVLQKDVDSAYIDPDDAPEVLDLVRRWVDA